MLTLKYIMGVRQFLDDTEGYTPHSSRTKSKDRKVRLNLAYYENPKTGDVVIAPKSREMLIRGFRELEMPQSDLGNASRLQQK